MDQATAGDRWGDLISEERQHQLLEQLKLGQTDPAYANLRGPFHFYPLTGADVFWLTALACWEVYKDHDPDHDMEGSMRGLRQARRDGWFELADGTSQHIEIIPSLGNLNLAGARLEDACLDGALLHKVDLSFANMKRASLIGTYLIDTALQGATLDNAHLEGAVLTRARLDEADLREAYLAGATLHAAHLEGANLEGAHLEGKVFADDDPIYLYVYVHQWVGTFTQKLAPADLQLAYFDSETRLEGATLGDKDQGYISIVDVQWNGVNLAVLEWPSDMQLGDERSAWGSLHWKPSATMRSTYGRDAEKVGQELRQGFDLAAFRQAVRANRQLVIALRGQGLNEEADRFAYRAQRLQRVVLRLQHKWGRWLFSAALDATSGYGYHPQKAAFTYLGVISFFAVMYFIFRDSVQPALNPLDALIFSVTSFHGRGFNPGESVSLHNLLTIFAGVEAIIGLLIEITFIATFTQRFFAR